MRVAVEQSQRFLGIVHHIMHPPTASGVQSDRTHLEVRSFAPPVSACGPPSANAGLFIPTVRVPKTTGPPAVAAQVAQLSSDKSSKAIRQQALAPNVGPSTLAAALSIGAR